jgi:hypothetical protein
MAAKKILAPHKETTRMNSRRTIFEGKISNASDSGNEKKKKTRKIFSFMQKI